MTDENRGPATDDIEPPAEAENPGQSGRGDGKGETTAEKVSFNRRGYLKGLTATATAAGAIGLSSTSALANEAPSASGEWGMAFEDDFDGDGVDDSNWALGWGWGLGAPGSKVSWARERHVNVSNSMLRLTASKEDYDSDGLLYVGAVHSKNRVTVEPPVYFEARCNFIEGVGWQNAFWSKPNTEAWPPEIDVVELLQPSASRSSGTSHNLHYSASGEPGDTSTHRTVNGSYSGYSSSAEWPGRSFHVYGVEWQEDAIRHYVDGILVEETTDQDIVDAFNNAGPEYLMLSLNLDNVGTTDKSGSWEGREFLCDWVRVWKPDPDGELERPSDGDDTTDEESGTDTAEYPEDQYLWARSADGEPVAFEFEAGQGNVRIEGDTDGVDYWVSDDGTTAGGTTDQGSGLPGFRFDGELAAVSYTGDLELYLNDEQIDPEEYVVEEPTGSEYLWARSDGSGSVSFEFEATEGNISIEGDADGVDYWVSDDGTTAGGTTDRTANLPGFRFDGEIAEVSYSGPLELYLNDAAIDPEEYVVEEPPEDQYLWARSSDGTEVGFQFEAGGGDIRIEGDTDGVDYWVTDDRTIAGGATDRRSGLPGFRFDGEITALSYTGSVDFYLNNELIDPDNYVG